MFLNTEEFKKQHLQIRKTGGYKILNGRSLIKISGKDALDYFNTQTSNNVKDLKNGEGQSNALLDRKGHLRAHFSVHKTEDFLLVIADKTEAEILMEHLEKFHFSEDFEMEDISENFSFVLIQGNLSNYLIKEVIETDLSLPNEHNIFSINFNKKSIMIINRNETGENGFLILIPKEFSSEFINKIIQIAEKYNFIEIPDKVTETLRIEAGIPLFGIDISEKNILPETGLEKTSVSYSKGCYLGQEVISKIKTYGTTPKALMGLEFMGNEFPPFDSEIIINNKNAGIIKSSTFSPLLQKPVSLAYINKEYRNQNETIEFEINKKIYKATIKSLPFYKSLSNEELAKKYYEEALSAFAESRDEEAVKLLEDTIKLKPDFCDAYESLGVILSRLERNEEAIRVMTKLTEISPEEPMARTNLSIFYMKTGNKTEAEAQMAKANAINFAKTIKENQQKKALEKKKQEEVNAIMERMEMFQEVLETEDSEDLIANYGMGKCYFDLEKYNEALPFFIKATEIKKDYSIAFLYLGKALEQSGKKEEAINTFKKGILIANQKGDLMPLKEMEQRLSFLEK